MRAGLASALPSFSYLLSHFHPYDTYLWEQRREEIFGAKRELRVRSLLNVGECVEALADPSQDFIW